MTAEIIRNSTESGQSGLKNYGKSSEDKIPILPRILSGTGNNLQ